MPESYADIEMRISEAIDMLDIQDKPNIAATSQNFNIPRQQLLAQWQGRQSRMDCDGQGKKLDKEQERAVCQYLNCLSVIKTSACQLMLIDCANTTSCHLHGDITASAPTVSQYWP